MTIEQQIAEALRPVIREEVRAIAAELRAALPPAPLVTVAEAARLVGVSVPTMRRRIKAGEVPVRRTGRTVRIDPAVLQVEPPGVVLELAHAARFPR